MLDGSINNFYKAKNERTIAVHVCNLAAHNHKTINMKVEKNIRSLHVMKDCHSFDNRLKCDIYLKYLRYYFQNIVHWRVGSWGVVKHESDK